MAKLNLTCIAEGKSMTWSLKNCFLVIFPIHEIFRKTKIELENQYSVNTIHYSISFWQVRRYKIAVLQYIQKLSAIDVQ